MKYREGYGLEGLKDTADETAELNRPRRKLENREPKRKLHALVLMLPAFLGLGACGGNPLESKSTGSKIEDAAKGLGAGLKALKKSTEKTKEEIRAEAEKRRLRAVAAGHIGGYVKDQLNDPFYRTLDPKAAREKLANQIIQDEGSLEYVASLPHGADSVQHAVDVGVEAMFAGKTPDEIAAAAAGAAEDKRNWFSRTWDSNFHAPAVDGAERTERARDILLRDWKDMEGRTQLLDDSGAEYDLQAERDARRSMYRREMPEVYRFKLDKDDTWSQPVPIRGEGKGGFLLTNTSVGRGPLTVAWELASTETGEPIRKRGGGSDRVSRTSVTRVLGPSSKKRDFREAIRDQFGDDVADKYGKSVYVSSVRVKAFEGPVEFTLILDTANIPEGFRHR